MRVARTVPLIRWIDISLFFFDKTPTTAIYTLSLHDALPIFDQERPALPRADRQKTDARDFRGMPRQAWELAARQQADRSEEHTSELQSRFDLVCRLLLEKKNYTGRDVVSVGAGGCVVAVRHAR